MNTSVKFKMPLEVAVLLSAVASSVRDRASVREVRFFPAVRSHHRHSKSVQQLSGRHFSAVRVRGAGQPRPPFTGTVFVISGGLPEWTARHTKCVRFADEKTAPRGRVISPVGTQDTGK